MKIFKNILLGILILFAIGIISYYAYLLLFRTIDNLNPPATPRENLQDSIFLHSERAKMHADSAAYYRHKVDSSIEESLRYRIDTTGWNRLRTAYKRNLETSIRASLAGQRDSLRVP